MNSIAKIMKIKKIILSVLIAALFMTNCNIIKTIKLMKNGEVIQKEFKVEVPFEYRLGLVILKVTINNNDYDFVLDTGAPNVISEELANTLNIKPIAVQKVEDSQNSKSNLGFARMDNINIGGLDFINTGVVISDIKSSQEVGCLNIDGFIGSNLMRKAIWKFDYQNQIITITNTLSSLDIPSERKKIPFFSEITGTPLCDISINGHTEKNVVIDLGSNGDITLSNKTYDKIRKNNIDISKMTLYGMGSSGLYGTGEVDTLNFVIASDITFGDIRLKKQIVEFSKGSSTIGMNFFKNYDLIINWFNKEILLVRNSEYDYSIHVGFGFSWLLEDEKLIVGSLTAESNAVKIGLKLNDQIIGINGEDYTSISAQRWCELLENKSKLNSDTINLTVSRNGEKLNFLVYTEKLLK